METKTVDTYCVGIFMGGDIARAKAFLRREFYPPNRGLCVTIEPTLFLYTGGEENGFVITLRNYPRFPSEPAELYARAKGIAEKLIVELCQWSAMIVASDKTEWLNVRPAEGK